MLTIYIIVSVVSMVVGFVIGVLVYRNNASKAEAELAKIKEELRKAKEKAGL